MKTKFKLLLTLVIAIFLVSNLQLKGQTLKELKEKAKKEAQNKMNKNNNSGNSNGNSNTSIMNSKANHPQGNEADAMYELYKYRTGISENWPYSVDAGNFYESYINAIEILDMPNFEQQMANDKSKYPDLFKFHGIESTKPSQMEFGSGGSEQPSEENLKWINIYITKYYQWKDKIRTEQNALNQCVQTKIVDAQQAMAQDKIDKGKLAVRTAKAIKSILPDNPMIDDLIKNAQTTLDKCFTDVKHLLTGKVHQDHYKEIVGFTEKPAIGSENIGKISNEISVGKPFYIVGYFADQIKNLGVTTTYKGVGTTCSPTLICELITDKSIYARQRMYWNTEMIQKVKEQSYFVYNLFPDINSIDFKSHLEYIPTLNIIKWLTYQMPGDYSFNFTFSDGSAGGELASSVFKIKLTKENIAELKEYHSKLMAKKIAAVTFNNENGCTDTKAKIGGKENMAKYGELIKLTCAETGKVMKPWPNDHLVNNYTASGYGVFKKSDGRYEIISVQYSRPPTSSEWTFASISLLNNFELYGNFNINAEIIDYGYEISKEGIEKCSAW